MVIGDAPLIGRGSSAGACGCLPSPASFTLPVFSSPYPPAGLSLSPDTPGKCTLIILSLIVLMSC